MWALEQSYVGPDGVARTRFGIVASLKVEPYETGTVLPHERTHAGPKEERLAPARDARSWSRSSSSTTALRRSSVPPGRPISTSRARSSGGSTSRPSCAFDDKQLLIATATTARRRRRLQPGGGAPASAQMLVVLVATGDPGLEIFATHRVFRAAATRGRARARDRRRGGARRARRRRAGRRRGDAGCRPDRPRRARPARRAPRRLAGPRGDRLHARRRRGPAARPGGRGGRRVPDAADADRGRLRLRAPRRGAAAEDDLLLPEVDLRPPLPPL